MKKIAVLVGVGLIGTVFMSANCSSNEDTGMMKQNKAELPAISKELKDEGGIEFKKLSLEKAMAEASSSDKLIFIDAYTSWCGPCKQMAATTFKDAEVGELFNENFVNIKIDIEKDADGPEVARLYNVRAYPTLLVIDGDGKLVKQVIGFQTKDRLMALAQSLL